ncbi:MAG: glycosyltransferase family 1 protein, partial [Rhodospirillaceae bacterium]|nr:glycosyltransferase family 1 protein [Rhodospirillaceae bacterium]
MAQKICQLCTVDFTLYHLLHPLMRALRDAGHEVVGVCADGDLVRHVRDDGFRIETVPLARSANPARNWRSGRALRNIFRREAFD